MQEEQNELEQQQQPAAESDPLDLMTGAPEEAPAVVAEKVAHRKVRTGLVVSNKMQKSIVVTVVRRIKHPLYKKYLNKTSRFMAHDENNECNIGDTVRIIETRPLSARKRWRLDTILVRAK
jgi:small subunit ribosomal protein S17